MKAQTFCRRVTSSSRVCCSIFSRRWQRDTWNDLGGWAAGWLGGWDEASLADSRRQVGQVTGQYITPTPSGQSREEKNPPTSTGQPSVQTSGSSSWGRTEFISLNTRVVPIFALCTHCAIFIHPPPRCHECHGVTGSISQEAWSTFCSVYSSSCSLLLLAACRGDKTSTRETVWHIPLSSTHKRSLSKTVFLGRFFHRKMWQ